MKFVKFLLLTSAFAMLSSTSFAQSAEQDQKMMKKKPQKYTTREECRRIVRAKLINASQAPSKQIKRTVEDICRRSSNLNP